MYTAFSITSSDEPLDCQKRSLEDAIANLPPLGALVRVRAAGVCHSDLHQWKDGGIRYSETNILKYNSRPGYEFPKVPGHEVAGVVHAFGGGVAPGEVGMSVGDRVSVYPWMGCGDCATCNSHDDIFCFSRLKRELGMCIDGGYAEFVTVPHHKYLVSLPPGVTFELGAMLGCSCLTAYCAIKSALSAIPSPLSASLPSVHIAIIGIGGLGQWALTLLPLLLPPMHANYIIVAIDSNPEKLEVAKKLEGVDGFLLNTAESAAAESNRFKTLHNPRGFNAILDFVNNPFTFQFSVDVLSKGGVLAGIGLFGGTGPLVLPVLSLKQLRIIGIMTGSRRDMWDAMDLVSRNIDKVKGPDLKFYRLEQCMEALDDLEKGRIKGRAILKM